MLDAFYDFYFDVLSNGQQFKQIQLRLVLKVLVFGAELQSAAGKLHLFEAVVSFAIKELHNSLIAD